MKTVYPNLHPDITRVRAVVTTRWGKSGYRPLPITQIESYFVDTSLDNDADSWQIEIGDPHGELTALFGRDHEIRVQLFGVGREGTAYILSGITDDVEFDETGVLTLTGRDYSSLALDSSVPPQKFGMVRAWSIVDQQARQIGFRQTSLSRATSQKGTYTDGSETYWEFWYRLYRKDQMWIWTEANGTLIAARLNYEIAPSYFLGSPHNSDPQAVQRMYIPVEHCSIHKTTQGRVGDVQVYYHRGDNGFHIQTSDPTTQHWIKRPMRLLLDTEAHTDLSARKKAWDEIFEGKVGSKEIRITIPDPGFPIRQNRIARVRISEMNLFGDYFVVGVKLQGGAQGFVQEVRLREKEMALTRRIPVDPKIAAAPAPAKTSVIADLGTEIAGLDNMPEEWGGYFVKAAKQFKGPWDYKLFLATLLGICYVETGFQNERQLGGPGGDVPWEPPPPGPADATLTPTQIRTGEVGFGPGQRRPTNPGALETWKTQQANEAGDGYITWNAGVGPMQLTEISLKHQADDRFKKGYRDEFQGGRWHPEHNIWIAASYLKNCLDQMVGQQARDIDMWAGVTAYNMGVAGAKSYIAQHNQISPYAVKVKNAVYNQPGYLTGVAQAIQAAQEAAKTAQDGSGTSGVTQDGDYNPKTMMTPAQALTAFKHASFPPSKSERRQLIVAAAIWGWHNKDSMTYSQGSQRMQDFGPPPNVPGNTDCSGFATWCYKVAGAQDPNGNNYNGSGYTGTLWDNGTPVSIAQLRPGDLCFYGTPDPKRHDAHVVVYVGFGKVVSNGGQSGPNLCAIKEARSDYCGSRSYIGDVPDRNAPAADTGGGTTTQNKRSVVIQAGHDTGSHSNQPYGHIGESGHSGPAGNEVDFNKAVRDAAIAKLNADNRFVANSGDAWTGSAGATAAPGDDINSKSDVFIAIHCYGDVGLTGFFFGWPDARGEAVIGASKKLRDSIAARYNFSGAPSRNASRDNTVERYYGYYAWGSPRRTFPNTIDHTAGTRARILIECGNMETEGIMSKESQIATALYQGICDYFDITPNP